MPLEILRFTVRTWRACGWLAVAVLCVESLMPPPDFLIEGPPYTDKACHLLAYAGVTAWLALGYAPRRWRTIGAAMALLGVALELLQGFTPLRTPSSWDEVANVAGVLLGLWLARRVPAGFPAFRRAQ